MLSWIAENLDTILICLVLAAIVGAIIAVMIRNHKRGKSSCGCGCSCCPMNGSCHSGKGTSSQAASQPTDPR